MSKETKEARLNIRIEPGLKEKIRGAAKAENRSVANYVINAIQERLGGKRTD